MSPASLDLPKHALTTASVDFVSTDNRTIAAPSPVLRTAPAYGFGSTTRDAHRKTGTLKAHAF